jgi:EAL domain-containing protein (putative c-di-GMP-specific phosphodiesterase class I)
MAKPFVDNIEGASQESAIGRAVYRLAETLNIDVIAEGIEREGQAAELRALHCQLGQGFHYSRPVAARSAGEKSPPARGGVARALNAQGWGSSPTIVVTTAE